jgi:hypothetical protein
MEYTKMHQYLKSIFSLTENQTKIEGSNVVIQLYSFSSLQSESFLSVQNIHSVKEALSIRPDSEIEENINFKYPVFLPSTGSKFSKAILLMHGLNERTWDKYLVWAFYLCQQTNRPVILFPISFHMNRSPLAWSNPRMMMDVVSLRKHNNEIAEKLSIANVALSERLSEYPLRFFNSGYQSAQDIIRLLGSIKEGSHPSFYPNSTVDVFAYSIGAYVSQILMLANPENLFSDSKLFMFCGGSFFSEMDGRSRLIMDNDAFNRIHEYYLNGIDAELKTESRLSTFLKSTNLGRSFRAMLSVDNLRSFRESSFKKLGSRIQAVSLMKDLVIPAKGIIAALGVNGSKSVQNVEVLDFPFEYSHESPFPVNNKSIVALVDAEFERVFNSAVAFLI